MNTQASLKETLSMALKLSPRERLQLIEQVASSIEHEIEVTPASQEQSEEHWGRNLLRLLDELGPLDLKYPEIEDPVEWVKQIRQDERQQRLGDWGEAE